MIVGVFSDTHGDTAAARRVYDALKEADAWIFLGDGQEEADLVETLSQKPMYRVKGNCDSGDIPKEQVITLGGARIFITHGHMYAVSLDLLRIGLRARELDCSAALYGHTHIPNIEYMPLVQVACPGSPSAPRGGRSKSFMKLEIVNGIVNITMLSAERK